MEGHTSKCPQTRGVISRSASPIVRFRRPFRKTLGYGSRSEACRSSTRACRRREWCVYPRSGRGWLLVGKRPAWGNAAICTASRGSIVQTPTAKRALITWDMPPTPPLPFALLSVFSIPGSYPKRYSHLSKWIVSDAGTDVDRRTNLVNLLHRIPYQPLWHAECGQVRDWPLTQVSTTSFGARSVGFGAQQVFWPALPLNRSRGDSR